MTEERAALYEKLAAILDDGPEDFGGALELYIERIYQIILTDEEEEEEASK